MIDQYLSRRQFKFGMSFIAGIVVCIAFLATIAGFAFAPASTVVSRKCVGMFVDSGRRTIAADVRGLTIVGTFPCANGVAAFGTQGAYRAFDDGSIEFLATPIPPCPDGDVYVWLRYPNSGM